LKKFISELDKDIISYVTKVKNRINTNVIISYGIKGLTISAIIMIVFILISRFTPIYEPYIKIIYIGALGLLLGIIVGLTKRYDNKYAALKLDSCGLNERTITAVELIGEASPFAVLQKEDALKNLKKVDYKRKFPIKPDKKYISVCMCFFIVVGITFFIPNPMNSKAEDIHSIEQAKKENTKKVEEVKKTIKKDSKLIDEQKKELEKQLLELQKDIKEVATKEDIDKKLQKAQKKIEIMRKNNLDKDLQKLVDSFSEKSITKELGEKIKNNKELKETLEKLNNALNSLNEEQKKQLALQLKNLSSNMMNKSLKNALNQLSMNLSSEDLNSLAQNLDDLSQTISQMMNKDNKFMMAAKDIENQLKQMQNNNPAQNLTAQNINQQNNQLQNNQQQNSQQSNQQQNNGTQQSAGNTGGNGNQNNNGNGNKNGTGAGGSNAGKGTGMGHENENSISQGEKNNSGIGNNKDSERKTGEYEKIFTPKHLGGDGEQTEIKGQKTGSNSSEILPSGKAPALAGEYIPYDKIVGDYKEKALENLNKTQIPEGMKEVVKEYFSSLEE
jgi:hypothetical protein